MRFTISNPQDDSDEKKKVAEPAPEPLGRDHYSRIEAALSYAFQDLSWLERALTHRFWVMPSLTWL
ncbi:MAG: hypothetical protein DCC75_05840 [Proteobacteria bacterium]|nr:MAG: hypothetical protein DCC75_05840 [Pseudomonadota bacterium]